MRMISTRGKLLIGVLLVFGFLVCGASAYTWSDHFTSDTSVYYRGDTGTLDWGNIGLGTGWMNDTTTTTPAMYWYADERFGSGTYTWLINTPNHATQTRYDYCFFGSQSIYKGTAYNIGVKYLVVLYESSAYLMKTNNAAWEVIDGPVGTANNNQGLINITTTWDVASGYIVVYDNGVQILSGTDNLITEPGYMGAGHSNNNELIDYDLWAFESPPVSSGSPPAAWLTGWSERQQWYVTGTTSDAADNSVTGDVVALSLYNTTGPPCNDDVYIPNASFPDFRDVRFTRDDGTTLLKCWIVRDKYEDTIATANRVHVLVELDKVTKYVTNTRYVYAGNPSAPNYCFDPLNVSIDYNYADHFNNVSSPPVPDTERWVETGTPGVGQMTGNSIWYTWQPENFRSVKVDFSENVSLWVTRAAVGPGTIGWYDASNYNTYWGGNGIDQGPPEYYEPNAFAHTTGNGLYHRYEIGLEPSSAWYGGDAIGRGSRANNYNKATDYYFKYPPSGWDEWIDFVLIKKRMIASPMFDWGSLQEEPTTPPPVADFSGVPTSGDRPLSVVFTDASTNTPTSWHWDFGDGNISTLQNPTHIYDFAGTFDVNLTATNFTLGESTVLKTDLIVATNPTPTAIANATPSTANQTVDIYFVDSSTGTNITKWTWDFRDGNTSAAKNPTNRFPSPGVYQVIHNVTDSDGTPWEVVSADEYVAVTIVNNSVSGDFAGIPTVGTVSFWTHFTWTGTGGPEETHTWDFGDGNTSTAGPDVWHLYEVTGTFWVNISVGNDAGFYFVNKTDYITANPHGGGGGPKPTADFSGTPLLGSAPLDVAFTDMSDCDGCLVWSWDFGDTGTSPLPNPSHTYTGPGLYAVTLMVVNASGSDTKTVPNYITVGQFSVDFTANVTTSPAPPLSVQFVATPTVDHVIDDWYWEFGDGNLDIVQNPVNTYITAGSFTVRLRIRNVTDTLESWQNKTGYINILDLNQTLKMSGDMGDSWIKWEWRENVTSNATPPRPVDLYLDGSPTETNYTPSYFYFQGLDPNSEHRLEIWDNITHLVLARSTLRTTPQEEMVLLILVFCAVLAVVTILQNDAKAMVTGTIGVVLASYGRSIAYNYYGLDWVFLAFAVGMMAVVAYMVIGIVREKLAWH